MASPKQSATLMALGCLLDQYNRGIHLTLLFTGVQGIGKSESIRLASQKLNGDAADYNYATIDGGTLNIGELTGIPTKMKTGQSSFNMLKFTSEFESALAELQNSNIKSDEIAYSSVVDALANKLLDANIIYTEELTYAKYPVLAKMEKLQEYYYNKAKTDGYSLPLGKLIIDEEGNEIINTTAGERIIVKKYNYAEQFADGFRNKFAFGENLSPEDRIHLMITGQIHPFFTLVDELNRPEQRTMNEMMNLVLNRRINGYNLPWWVCLAGAQNPAGFDSDYATTDLEPAQLDRFCFINMFGNIDDWAIHALNSGISEEYVYSVHNHGEQCFSPDDLVQRSQPTIKPSPRSNTIAGLIIKNFNSVINLPCFTDDERRDGEFYLSTLLNGILGQTATNVILLSIKDKENMITIPEILTGMEPRLTERAIKLIKNKTTIAQTMMISSLINWLCQNWTRINKMKSSPNMEEQQMYHNYYQQLAALMDVIEPAVMNYFCNQINTGVYDIRLADGTLKPNANLLAYVFEFLQYNKRVLDAYSSTNKLQNQI